MGCIQSCLSSNDNQSPRAGQRRCETLRCCGSVPILSEKRCKITGCVYLDAGYLVIADFNNRRVKLYDPNLKCRSYLNLDFRPYDICANGNKLYVTFPKKKLVQKISVTVPLCCVNRKLIKRDVFPTEAECRAIVAYKEDLIISVKFSTHADIEITDSSWQIHIVSTEGIIKRRITHDADGAVLIHEAKYICLTPNNKELVISEAEDNRVKCLDIEKGTLTFNHHMEDPKGVICDKHGNIYVLGINGTIRWILADRQYVKILLNGVKSVNYSKSITYSRKTNTLAVPRNENKVELYRIKSSIHDYD